MGEVPVTRPRTRFSVGRSTARTTGDQVHLPRRSGWPMRSIPSPPSPPAAAGTVWRDPVARIVAARVAAGSGDDGVSRAGPRPADDRPGWDGVEDQPRSHDDRAAGGLMSAISSE